MIDRRVFRYPLEPCPTVAVVSDTLHLPRNCHSVAAYTAGSAGFRFMETLAAPANWLLGLEPGDWRPGFPVVAFTGLRQGFLDDVDRHVLWSRFGVPVFEQLLDEEGRIVAVECEAHAGLHLEDNVRHSFNAAELMVNGCPTGISASEATEICGCGRAGVRLTDACAAMSRGLLLPSSNYLPQLPPFFSRITEEATV
jgi:hypothetical protein